MPEVAVPAEKCPVPKNTGIKFLFSSRRRHMRFSRDWSSDVCSSDLNFGLWDFQHFIFMEIQSFCKEESRIAKNLCPRFNTKRRNRTQTHFKRTARQCGTKFVVD